MSKEEKEDLKKRMRGLIKEEGSKKKHNKGFRKRVMATSVSAILLCGLAVNSESVIASMRNFGKNIENYFGKEENSLKPYKDGVLKSVDDKGIEFSLNELILNDEELVVSITIDYNDFDFNSIEIKENKEKNVDVYPGAIASITLDGKEVDVPGCGGSYDYDVENKITNVVLNFDMEGADLSKDYNIKIDIPYMSMKEGFKDAKIVEGNWTLDTGFNGKKLMDEVEVRESDQNIDVDKYLYQDYKITEIRKTPVSTVIKYAEEDPNRVRKEGEKFNHLDLRFFDENGEKLDFISKGGSSDRGFAYEYTGNENLTKVKVVPVVFEERNALFRFFGMSMKEVVLEDKAFEVDLSK